VCAAANVVALGGTGRGLIGEAVPYGVQNPTDEMLALLL
jgi:hypothetical protein